ncbi:MAG: hypothetical protein K2H64_11510 [Desulfovibrio sp.]|nr:hypothetical protein [Desulfovibrio sp.]
MTIEEQDAYMAKGQCRREADNAYPFFPGPANPEWYDYYVWCMNSVGIPDYVINRMRP